jgi:hypothetical protein
MIVFVNQRPIKSLEDAAQVLANRGLIQDIFETTVTVQNTVVTIRGRITDGVAKINTAFIPRN